MPKPENVRPYVRKKGDPPLPGAGRPKGSLNSKTILGRLLGIKEVVSDPFTGKPRKITQLELITLKQLEKARAGNLNSYNAILNRYEGMPEQRQIQEFEEGTEIYVNVGQPKKFQQVQEPETPPDEPETPVE